MRKWQQWLVLGVLAAGFIGCGEKAADDKKAAAAPAAAAGPPGGGAPAGGAAPGGAPGGAPGIAAGGGGAPANPGAAAGGAAPAANAAGMTGLLKYVPASIKIAAGANFSVITDPKNAINDKDRGIGLRILSQFQPATDMLARGGVKTSSIDLMWTGNNRDTNDLAICVQTKANYDKASFLKGLKATGDVESVNKIAVHSLSGVGDNKNAVAFIDGKTLLVGRHTSVVSAINAPAPGAVQWGYASLDQPAAYFWIAGDDSYARFWLSKQGLDVMEILFADAVHTRGMAVCFSPPGSGAGGQGGAGRGAGPPGMGPPGMGAGAPGMGPGAPGVGPGAAGGAGAPPGGPPNGAMPGMPGAGGAGGSSDPVDLDLTLCMSFASPALAAKIDTKINEIQKLLTAAKSATNRPGTTGMPGMPGGAPGGPPGPPGAGNQMIVSPFQGAQPPPRGPGAGAPGGPGGAPGAPGGPAGAPPQPPGGGPPQPPGPQEAAGQSQARKSITYTKTVVGNDIRMLMGMPIKGIPFVSKFINDVIQSTGASALTDGIFEGTVLKLSAGFKEWQLKNPAPQKGLNRLEKFKDRSIRIGYSGYSWMTSLLPYIGHHDLYTLFTHDEPWMNPENEPYAMVSIPAYLNPADQHSHWNGLPFDGMALTHFAGMAGIETNRNEVAGNYLRSDPRAGIFGYDQIAQLSDVTDGAGQTILVIGTGAAAAPWVMGGGATIRGARLHKLGEAVDGVQQFTYFDEHAGFGSKGVEQFGIAPRPKTKGAPNAGTFVLFADGSAKAIPSNINPKVFEAMCTMHGAEQTDMNEVAIQENDKPASSP